MSLQVVILAAGQGKRMQSAIPKVLHTLGGRPLLSHVIETATKILNSASRPIIVTGHGAEHVKKAFHEQDIEWVYQAEQLGTAHALMQTIPHLQDDSRVLVLYGDVPLISAHTLQKLIMATPSDAVGILTKNLPEPFGYGRIIRDDLGRIQAIVEEKDLSSDEKQIHEINTGIYCFPAHHLKTWLPQISNHNAQHELYLTDTIAIAARARVPIHSIKASSIEEISGVNDCIQLAALERYYQKQQAINLMENGVKIMDPSRIDIRGDVLIGTDVTIDINVILEGRIEIGSHSYIGPNTYLKNMSCKDHVIINANSVIENAMIGEHCQIGPFARIRPETTLRNHVHIGNFVEIKNSVIDDHSKVNHLSYIGDSEVGKRVNIGAGTITCNYDGAHKHKTVIHDDVHIGSGSELVAPIDIGMGATIGAGSIVTQNAAPNKLTLTHTLNQRSIDWQRPVKTK